MLKPHCPDGNHFYIGEVCSYTCGRKPPKLQCECGKPAIGIYIDKIGEWPLCMGCLELELDEIAPMPLLTYTNIPQDEIEQAFEDPQSADHVSSNENPL